MNPELQSHLPADEALFDLLEHPERWPDDPELQAQLAELLEVHLALQAHGTSLKQAIPVESDAPSVPAPARFRSTWFLAAAAALLVLAPSAYVLQKTQAQKAFAARIEASARQRSQTRLWAAFFEQSSDLLRRFESHPALCKNTFEDRSEERMLAMALLEASHQLAGQASPIDGTEAENARTQLHAWLMELKLEDGCLSPERAQELRRMASTMDLEGEAQRMSQLLKGQGS
ncbi:MAG: hypothetical protein LWX11_04510 [Firmicutes bacterium]|nr:hypothetical protein [Bacillota bacterium]